MASALFTIVAALALQTAAFPQASTKAVRQASPASWSPAGAGDARAPCPGLNTLANHGFINHDGRGITKQQMQQGFLDAFGLAFEITADGGQNALNLQCDNCQTFDLDTLNQPHQIEHDGSMSRLDFEMPWNQHANNFAFNQTVWDESQDLFGCNTHTTPQLSNYVRTSRFAQAQQDDVAGWFVRNDGGSLAEHGFILSSMHDYSTGPLSSPSARLDWINYWLVNERLPSALGWVKPDTVAVDTFNSIVNAIGGAPSTSVVPKSQCAPTSASSVPATATPASATTTASIIGSPAPLSSATTTASIPGKPAPLSSAPFPAGNSSVPLASGTGTGVGTSVGTKKPDKTSAPATVLPSGTAQAGTSQTPSTITGTSAASTSIPASVTSSAKSKATELAGPAPTQPNAYTQVLSHSQWVSFSDVITKYIVVIENLCSGLLGSHVVGSMPMPGAQSAGNGAPWMNSMAAPPAAMTTTITDVTTVTATAAGDKCSCA